MFVITENIMTRPVYRLAKDRVKK